MIDHRVATWANDPKMSQYLTPQTLFRPGNFDKYLNRAKKAPVTAKDKFSGASFDPERPAYQEHLI